ncbi:MAG TPA: hypothetical protein DD670_16560, partial [Planctomycetaceae bacterium]|nr:hypothetical protein [Planctomycetaceae bacterium]
MTTDPHSDTNADLPQEPDARTHPADDVAAESIETTSEADAAEEAAKPRILIGSQRDVGAPVPRKRDWFVPGEKKASDATSAEPAKSSNESPQPAEQPAPTPQPTAAPPEPEALQPPVQQIEPVAPRVVEPEAEDSSPIEMQEPPSETKHFPPPNIRAQLPPDLEEELEAALGDASLDDLMIASETIASGVTLEAESKHQGRVVAVHREDVFIELGSREQGLVPLKQFAETPEPGAEVTVAVVRFNQEDGLYELRLPGSAASVGDWS